MKKVSKVNIMRESIISVLSEDMSLDLESIAKKLEIKNKGMLHKELTSMVNEGVLDYSDKKNKYLLFENSHLIKANIGKVSNGLREVNIDGKKVFIARNDLSGATYNDLVALEVVGNKGKVVRIIKKDANNYVCEVVNKNNKLCLFDKRLGTLELNNTKGFVEGQKVLVRCENGCNKVLEVIGHKDDPGVDIKAVLYDHGFIDNFDSGVIKELREIPIELSDSEIESELRRGRLDHRDRNIVTIDGDDTKDIDDGISIKKLSNGNFELSVYIADVSHYVSENSAIDRDAYRRGTSVYPPDSVSPMLDHKLSNGICSLNPNTDRLAMCYTTTFNKFGKVIDFQVNEAIINSKKKMTYSAINDILERDIIRDDYCDYLADIYIMYQLSVMIYDGFLKQGYLNFLSKESKVILDEFGNSIEISLREYGPAQKIIEMFMIITNIELTRYAHFLNLPWIYRVHDDPSEERLEIVYNFLKFKNYVNINKKSNYTRRDILKTIQVLSKYDNAAIFNSMLISCQDKAIYSDENIGHYALATDFYSHNTSPIRRYPDLQNQRILKDFLHYGLEYVQKKYGNLREVAIHCSIQERKAALAERESTNMKKVEYMQDFIGEIYTGYITYVSEDCFWVELDNTVRGCVFKSDLPYDNYKYSHDIISLIGKNYTYSVGDRIEVKVKNVNKRNCYIDFVPNVEYKEEKVSSVGKVRGKRKRN